MQISVDPIVIQDTLARNSPKHEGLLYDSLFLFRFACAGLFNEYWYALQYMCVWARASLHGILIFFSDRKQWNFVKI